MSLQGSFRSATLQNQQISPVLEMDVPRTEYIQIPIYECIKGFPADHYDAWKNEYLTPQPYHYGVNIEFEQNKGSEFLSAPGYLSRHQSIANTISEMMGETLAYEMSRDLTVQASYEAGMPDQQFSQLMKNIHENTLEDAEIVLEDLPAILQQTFPDSGIIGAKLGYIEGINLVCSTPTDKPSLIPRNTEELSASLSGGVDAIPFKL